MTKRVDINCLEELECSEDPETGRKQCLAKCGFIDAGRCWATRNSSDIQICNDTSDCGGCLKCHGECAFI